MQETYFVLEVQNFHEDYKIQLTKAGWAKQSRAYPVDQDGRR